MPETETQNNLLIPLILNDKYFKIKQLPKTENESIKAECDLWLKISEEIIAIIKQKIEA